MVGLRTNGTTRIPSHQSDGSDYPVPPKPTDRDLVRYAVATCNAKLLEAGTREAILCFVLVYC